MIENNFKSSKKNYYRNIKELIEINIVEVKKNEISSNYHTLMTYFNVGKILIEAQGGKKRAKYGTSLIKTYSTKLSKDYGKFYSIKNLELMRQMALILPIANTLYSQLNWSLIKVLLPIKDTSKRNYYLNSCIEHNFRHTTYKINKNRGIL